MIDFLEAYKSYFAIFSIPFISAFVGWLTNRLAIKMTFYPLEFKGIRPIGWQGIIPSKAKKMAETAVDLWTSKLINMEVEFDRIEPARVAQEMKPSITELAEQITNEVMIAKMPATWKRTPDAAKASLYESIAEELPVIVENMMKEVKLRFNEFLDLKYLSVSSLTQNKSLLNRMFLKCGAQEFKFIEKSGFYFGFLFGLVQMTIWYFYSAWWMLPVAGVLVGYMTNWLALKLIFRPLQPIKIGPVTFQGLFIKRQKEVSEEYSQIVASKIITVENIFEYIVRGPGSEKLMQMTSLQIGRAIEKAAGSFSPVIKIISGQHSLDHMRNIAVYRFMQELPMNIRTIFGYAENALDLEKVLQKKMKGLTPIEFEQFLRPVFKEDEQTLILVGAVLGGIAGVLQYLLLFA